MKGRYCFFVPEAQELSISVKTLSEYPLNMPKVSDDVVTGVVTPLGWAGRVDDCYKE